MFLYDVNSHKDFLFDLGLWRKKKQQKHLVTFCLENGRKNKNTGNKCVDAVVDSFVDRRDEEIPLNSILIVYCFSDIYLSFFLLTAHRHTQKKNP